jgi:UDPglucose--hexose-1-phosphate uridylyltransferase
MTPVEIIPVIETWTSIYAAHTSPRSVLAKLAAAAITSLPPQGHMSAVAPKAQYRYMQIFENKGAAMGCSNAHPHGQIWTVTGTPEEPAAELAQMMSYRKEHGGSHMLEDYATLEAAKQERVVWENDGFVIVCPWWAVWPFETMIVSKTHKRALLDFDGEDRENLAQAISVITRKYDKLFDTQFPYSELLAIRASL